MNLPRCLAALTTLLAAGLAQAQFARAEATYASADLVVHVVMLDPEGGAAAASATVVAGACSASLAGTGTLQGRTLEITPYVKQAKAEACRLTLQFDPRWQTVRATDNGACTFYQGSGCGWSGQTARRFEPPTTR